MNKARRGTKKNPFEVGEDVCIYTRGGFIGQVKAVLNLDKPGASVQQVWKRLGKNEEST